MRKRILIATVLAAIAPMIASAQSSDGYYGGSYTRMSYVKGEVYVQRGQDLGYEQGELNLVVIAGDKIGTKDGRVEIQLGGRNYLRLDGSSQVDVVALPAADGDPTKLHLLSGCMFLRVNTLAREKSFEIHTADASFYIMEDGLYRVDVRENRETEFSVWSGSAEAAGEEGSILVRERQRITASDGRITSEPTSEYARRDSFSEWNESRESTYAKRSTKTYLPAEYVDYDYELADYGDWAYESSYGYVWVPRHTYSDWRPYYDGRWVWYPIIGWTWVSYEPWGWCTSHYGRWGWGSRHGWYWIPYSRWSWGPAWVHWYWDRDYIGWCPLSYYNYPGVLFGNRFYDRYSYGRFPHDSRALTMVHRAQMQDRRMRNAALDRDRIGRIGSVNMRAGQPDMRPSIDRNGATAIKARGVLSRESLRSVGRNFDAGGRKLSPNDIRSSISKRSPDRDTANDRKIGADRMKDTSSDRNVRSDSSRLIQRPSSRDSVSGSSVRSFPSRRTFENGSGNTVDRSRINPTNRNENSRGGTQPGTGIAVPRLRNDDGNRTIREIRPKTIEPEKPIRSVDSQRTVRERSGGNEGTNSAPRRSLQQEGNQKVTSPVERPSRSIIRNDSSSRARQTAPSRTFSAPSRSTSSSPRTDNPSSRITTPSRFSSRNSSSPSRSDSAPSRSYSAPSRSSSAPSRSYSAPSRSSSAPSRSYSAPSRSSSSPSRSYSAPSRSSSSGSKSSSSRGSSSSGSGGRIRK